MFIILQLQLLLLLMVSRCDILGLSSPHQVWLLLD